MPEGGRLPTLETTSMGMESEKAWAMGVAAFSSPGPGDEEADPRPARGPGIAVGHEARALLMARLDMADAASRQAAVKLEGMRARNAEHGVDAHIAPAAARAPGRS